MSYYLTVLKKYAMFKGRARRKEYWMFILIHCIFSIIAMILDNLFCIAIPGQIYGFIYLIYNLIVLIPLISVTVRRLHDINKSGGWIFILLIPIIGAIWLLILLCANSISSVNRFGSNPKKSKDFIKPNKSIEPQNTNSKKPNEFKEYNKPIESKEPIKPKQSKEPTDLKEQKKYNDSKEQKDINYKE